MVQRLLTSMERMPRHLAGLYTRTSIGSLMTRLIEGEFDCGYGRSFLRLIHTSLYPLRRADTEVIIPDDLLPVVALVGRPNVGKSALFNRLVRSRKAIVHDTPGGHVTRDYQESPAKLGDIRFLAVDTSGLEPFSPTGTIQWRATALTSKVLHRADVVLLMLDGKTGIVPGDIELCRWLRRPESGSVIDKLVLVANKCEYKSSVGKTNASWMLSEASSLGFGEPIPISAETGDGMPDLYNALIERVDPIIQARESAMREIGGIAAIEDEEVEEKHFEAHKSQASYEPLHESITQQNISETSMKQQKPVKVAIMGLVNVGKSTLTNQLLKEERCLTGPEPGLTRDAITTRITLDDGRPIDLVDTAGWLKRTKASNYDETGGAVTTRTLEEARTVLRFVHIVILVVDAKAAFDRDSGLTHAESSLAADVISQGRVLIIVGNKIDSIPGIVKQQEALELVQSALQHSVPEVNGGEVLAISALSGDGVEQILPLALNSYEKWCSRITTSKLNRWVEELVSETSGGGPTQDLRRIKFISQIKTRPPTFIVFVSGSSDFRDATKRYLSNRIREEFGFEGVPVRLEIRKKERRRQKG